MHTSMILETWLCCMCVWCIYPWCDNFVTEGRAEKPTVILTLMCMMHVFMMRHICHACTNRDSDAYLHYACMYHPSLIMYAQCIYICSLIMMHMCMMHTSVIFNPWLCCMCVWCGWNFVTNEQGDSRSRIQCADTYEACIYDACMCDACQKWGRTNGRTGERTESWILGVGCNCFFVSLVLFSMVKNAVVLICDRPEASAPDRDHLIFQVGATFFV